ncbi:3-oxoacyl-ACP synthase III family protein [Paraliomyxa miuraensis]|uniref:3-oxoacyl-ACP synthase III family protein n=1 Tax=Paraliomyxa miuraensis TaxID=376150 RepID=UPI00224CFD4C|nr:ketoacyl-ACP synthase III [Paraliomyxa miuraensis]MCX4244963.1 ketoacyl-ACP synthase III [Paraliomyxa miuraensis]
MTRYAQILSTGRYIPARRITNAELDGRWDRPVSQWLVDNVGIEARHVMSDDETTSDLVVAAARQALQRAGRTPADVDLLIVATDTPDQLSPATASVVQAKLEALHAGTFDVNAACAGWVTALDLAARYIATEPGVRHVLVCGGYAMTRFLDWDDKRTATLFADGAGAVLLGAGDEPGFLAGQLRADGRYHGALGIYTGGARHPATPERVTAGGKPHVAFVEQFPATFNSEQWPPLIRAVLERAGLPLRALDLLVFTQLNARTIEQVMGVLELPMERTHMIMKEWGYLGSACIPAAFDDAVQNGKAPPVGGHVLFCATGGGLAMGASVWRMTHALGSARE